MSASQSLPPEGSLLEVIEKISPLAWRKYQSRYMKVCEDRCAEHADMSTRTPYISFRFECEARLVVDALLKAVDSYSGRMLWVMVPHSRDPLPGINWRIIPKRVFEIEGVAIELGMSSGQYMSRYEPELGPVAYDDLMGLTSYMKQIFGQGK